MYYVFIAVLGFSFFSSTLFASVDESSEILKSKFPFSERFENIEKSNQIITENKVFYESDWGLHYIRLKKGDHVIVEVPENRKLLIFNPNIFLKDKLSVFQSNEGCLYVSGKSRYHGHYVSVDEPSGDPFLCRLELKENIEELDLALFISRFEDLPKPLLYRDKISGDLKYNKLHNDFSGDKEDYLLTHAGETVRFNLSKTGRYRLRSRYLYSDSQKRREAVYQLFIQVNASKNSDYRYEVTPDNSTHYTLDGNSVIVGKEQNEYFQVDSEDSEILVTANRDTLISLSKWSQPDFLYPRWNLPVLTDNVFEQESKVSKFLGDYQNLESSIYRGDYKRSGLEAWKRIEFATKDSPPDSLLKRLSNKIYYEATEYRALHPQEIPKQSTVRYFSFINPSLQRSFDKEFVVSKQFQGDLIDQSKGGYFYKIKDDDQTSKLTYCIPKSLQGGRIRISVLPSQRAMHSCLIRFDNGEIYRLLVDSNTAKTLLSKFRVKGTEAALFSEIKALQKESYPRVSQIKIAGTCELDLPQGSMSFDVIPDGHCLPEIAFAIRQPSSIALSENDLIDLWENKGKRDFYRKRFFDLIQGSHEVHLGKEARIDSYLMKTVRWVQLEANSLKELFPKIDFTKNSDVNGWLEEYKKAIELQERGDVVSALNSFLSACELGDSNQVYTATLKAVEILKQLDELYLARLLCVKSLMTESVSSVSESYMGLLKVLSEIEPDLQKRNSLAVSIACYHICQNPNIRNINRLAGALWKNGSYQDALTLSLLGSLDKKSDLVLNCVQALDYSFFKGEQKITEDEPNQITFEPSLESVFGASGTRLIYSINRDVWKQYYLATANTPVRISVEKGDLFRLEMRPLHSIPTSNAVNGRIALCENGDVSYIPYKNNICSSSLRIESEEAEGAGIAVYNNYVCESNGDLEVYDPRRPLLVSVEKKQHTNDAHLEYKKLPRERHFSLLDDGYKLKIIDPEEGKVDSIYSGYDVWKTLYALYGNDPSTSTSKPTRNIKDSAVSVEEFIQKIRLQKFNDSSYALGALNRVLEVFPHKSAEIAALLWQINQEKPSRVLSDLLLELNGYNEWELLKNYEQCLGVKYIEEVGWNPNSPYLRIRKSCLTNFNPKAYYIWNDDSLSFSFRNISDENLRVRCEQAVYSFFDVKPVTFEWWVDDSERSEITLSETNRETSFQVHIPEGDHMLRFSIKDRSSNQMLAIEVKEEPADKNTLQPISKKKWIAGSKSIPYIFQCSGPILLRIDKWDNGVISSEYRNVLKGGQVIDLHPKDDSIGYYRIYKSVPSKITKGSIVEVDDTPVEELPDVELPQVGKTSFPVVGGDQYSMGKQEDGTFSLSARYEQRKNGDDDITEKDIDERFYQFDIHHRHFSESNNSWFNTGFLWRIRQSGGSVWGVSENITVVEPRNYPVSMGVDMRFFAQSPRGSHYNLFDGDDLEYMGSINLSVWNSRKISSKIVHIPKFLFWGRTMSISNSDGYPVSYVDRDVYTEYKDEHQYGYSLGDTLYWSPWRDFLVYTNGTFSTNEDLNVFSPDKFSFRIGIRQKIGPWVADVGTRHYYYFKDEDRLNSGWRNYIGIDLKYDYWLEKLNRLEVGLKLNWDIDKEQLSGGVFISYHFGTGRVLRDFPSREIWFHDLKVLDFSLREKEGLQ